MPYIHVKITKDHAATPEQKAEIIRGMTQVLVDTLGISPKTTVVTIEEVPLENWGLGGDPITVAREKQKAKEEEWAALTARRDAEEAEQEEETLTETPVKSKKSKKKSKDKKKKQNKKK